MASVNKNTAFNTIKSVFSVIYPLITFPYISRVLLVDNVGKINFGNSIVCYFALIASLGVTTYAVRECAKVRMNRNELSTVSSEIFSINILSSMIAYIALAVTLIFASSLEQYRELICIQSVTILFTTLGADWLNTAMEDFKYIAVRTMLMQIITLLLMFLFVHNPDDYILYVVISVLAASGANILNIWYRKRYCDMEFTLNMNMKKHLPPIMVMFSMIFAQVIYCNSDITILGFFKGDFEVGLYSTSVKIYNIVNSVIASVAWVVMPQLSAGFANNNYIEINRLLKYALNYIVILGIPAIISLNMLADPIIFTLAGPEYMGATVPLRILTISLLCSFIGGWIGNMMLLPAGKEKICLRCCIISAVINIILNLIFIPKYGFIAAALTTVIAELVGLFIMRKYIDVNIKIENVITVIRGPMIGGAMMIIMDVICFMILDSMYLITAIAGVISVISYALVLWILKDEFFINFANPMLQKFRGGE